MSLNARFQVALASALTLSLSIFCGIGAPPSEFAPRSGTWWALEPLMFPALFGGVALAIAACISSLSAGVRASAYLCIAAALSTGLGVVISTGISERPALRFLAIVALLLAVPAFASARALAIVKTES